MSDAVLERMLKNLPPGEITREAYLDVAYFGNPPAGLSAEDEAKLPEQFQTWNVE